VNSSLRMPFPAHDPVHSDREVFDAMRDGSPLADQLARYDHLHDVRRSGEDAENPSVGVEPTDRVFLQVAGGAVQLHALVDDPALHLCSL